MDLWTSKDINPISRANLFDYEFPAADIDKNLEAAKDFPKPQTGKTGKW